MNAIIMWAWHRVFDILKPDSKWAIAIDKIDQWLYQKYYDIVYNNLRAMREIPPKEGMEHTRMNTWLVALIPSNENKDYISCIIARNVKMNYRIPFLWKIQYI